MVHDGRHAVAAGILHFFTIRDLLPDRGSLFRQGDASVNQLSCYISLVHAVAYPFHGESDIIVAAIVDIVEGTGGEYLVT